MAPSNMTYWEANMRSTSDVLYQESYTTLDRYYFWNLQPYWAKVGLRVISVPCSHSNAAREVLKLVLERTVGQKEKCKKERGHVPGVGMRELWWTLRRERILGPSYRDFRNGDMVLYEESFYGDFWLCNKDEDSWWARGIGFRVVQCVNPDRFRYLTATLPPEILLIISQHLKTILSQGMF